MTPRDDVRDVVVIGGGVSGLLAAYRLQQCRRRVTLVDAGAVPGGVIATHLSQGFLVETGANSTLDSVPLLGTLLAELGIAAQRVDVSAVAKRRFVVRNAQLVALPGSPPELLRTRAFSLRGKLRLLREPFVPAAAASSEESIAAFVRRRLGSEVHDYAVDPFVSGIYAGDPERISVRAAFPRLYSLEQQHGGLLRGQRALSQARQANGEPARQPPASFSFRDGMQTLPLALARRLDDHIANSTVASIGTSMDGTYTVTGPNLSLRARAVVVAVPAAAAATLVAPLAEPAASLLRAIEYAPVAVVATGYPRANVTHDLAGFGFLVPRRERREVLGALFSSSLFEHRAPDGQVLLTTFVGGARDPAALALDDAALTARVERELTALVGAHEPSWSRVVRWPRAIPQYTIGHLDRIAAIDEATRAHAGLYSCGSWRGGVSVGDCLASADALAKRVDATLG